MDKNKGGRPKKKIDKKQFEGMCMIQCTQEEICSVLDVSDKTLYKWCHETYKKPFSVVFSEKKQGGKMSLRRQQWELARQGNSTMNIWLGKNLLKQSDNPLQDEIKLRELALKEREFDLKEKILLRQLEEVDEENDVAKAIREVFGVVANGDNK